MATNGLIVAAVSSGSGKTTITNGLLRAFSRRGLKAMPFKVGPDFIDTQFHRVASGRDSINLDIYMSGENHVRNLVNRYSVDADVCVVEGVMGLFDGYDCRKGSAAHVAEITGFPVVLVIDASSSAYSLAPVLVGFKNFDPMIRIAGVIFNNIGSELHLHLVREASKAAGVEMLGYLKRDRRMSVPSRHLGLSLGDDSGIEEFVGNAANAVESTIDIEKLLGVTKTQPLSVNDCDNNALEFDGPDAESEIKTSSVTEAIPKEGRKIAVAYDEAFNFIYPENLKALQRNPVFGGEIKKFSPIHDELMPEADFLYLPGGYPELYAEKLAANESMRESVREFIEGGGYALAECGGMLYLSQDIDGNPMCGVLPLSGTMENARMSLGYREVDFGKFRIRGHEFHYSSVIEDKERINGYLSAARQSDVYGKQVSTPVYRYKNLLAGYTHYYWADKALEKMWE